MLSTLSLVAAGLGVTLVPESMSRLEVAGVTYRRLARSTLRGPAYRSHAASTEMSTNASGRRSTCATSVIARPELVRPVSRTRAPYSG